MAVIVAELRMMKIMVGHGVRVLEKPMILPFSRNEFMPRMARSIDEFVVEHVNRQCDGMHGKEKNEQGEKAELKNRLKRLKRENSPWRGRDRFMMTRMKKGEER